MSDQISVDMIVSAISKGFDKLITDTKKTGEAGEQATRDLSGLGGELDRLLRKVQAATPANAAFAKQIDEVSRSFNKGEMSAEQAATALNKIKAGMNPEPPKKMALSFTELNSAISIARQGFDLIKGVIDETAGVTLDYAMRVQDASRAMGANAEEASALLQVADDLRVSEETLKIAFRQLNDQGIAPNIENLKKLAIEYQSFEDPVKRAQFAAEKFGMRAGPEMQKLLEATPAAIDDIAESAARAGLIMDEKGVAAAERYRLELDQLNDSVEGAKIRIGNQLIPVLGDLVGFFNAGRQTIDEGKASQLQLNLAMLEATLTGKTLTEVIDGLNKELSDDAGAAREAAYATQFVTEAARQHALAASADADAMDDVQSRYQPYIDATYDATNAIEQQRLAQQLANQEASDAQNIFNMQADAARNLTDATATLAEAQANWSQSVGTDLASQLEAALGDTDKFEAALSAVDEIMGTNTRTAEEQQDKMAGLIDEYRKTGDLDAFKQGVSELKDEFLPLNEQVKEAQQNVDALTQRLDALSDRHITTYLDVIITQQGTIPGGGGGGGNCNRGGDRFGGEQEERGQVGTQMMGGSGPAGGGMSEMTILATLTRLLTGNMSIGGQLKANRNSGRGMYGGV